VPAHCVCGTPGLPAPEVPQRLPESVRAR
jgi:hypothetical protein